MSEKLIERTCKFCNNLFLATYRNKGCCSRICASNFRAATPLSVRIQKKLGNPDFNGCIPWIGSLTDQGYGKISSKFFGNKSKSMFAHRVYFELANGPIPDDIFVLHKCDNPQCCNLDHLFLGTKQDNSDDAKRKNRIPYGEYHSKAKMTESIVIEARSIYDGFRKNGFLPKGPVVRGVCANCHEATGGKRLICLKCYKELKYKHSVRFLAKKFNVSEGSLRTALFRNSWKYLA